LSGRYRKTRLIDSIAGKSRPAMLARAVIVFRDRLGTRGIDGARIVVRHRLIISGNRSRGGRDAARIIIVAVVRGSPLAHQLLQLLRAQPRRVGIRGVRAVV
jgi:hypothetical protein